MSANDTTSEARKAAMIENATLDKLDVRQDQPWLEDAATDEDKDVETPPLSPELEPDQISYRADVIPGTWKPPISSWKIGDGIYLRLRDNKTAGPFYIVSCHPPANFKDKWRYDIKDGTGKVKTGISESIIV